MDYQEELELAVDWARDNMPDDVREAISEANASLYYGPSAGRFETPLAIVREWAESIGDIQLTEFAYDDDGEEVEIDAGCIDSSDIVAAIVGRELARYL